MRGIPKAVLDWKLTLVVSAVLLFSFLAGCGTAMSPGELALRQELAGVSENYNPSGTSLQLPTLRADSGLDEILTFGIINDPAVASAYYDWKASVEAITVARSIENPKLLFEADIADVVMALMPGIMLEFPGSGKLSAMGEVATAEGQARFFAFKRATLLSAAAIKTAYYRLQAVDESIRVNRLALELLEDLRTVAQVQHETGKVTLQDVLRAEIERDKLLADIENLEDLRDAQLASYKGTLGVNAETVVPFPASYTNSSGDVTDDGILETAFKHNPRLKEMQAQIAKAEAMLRLAKLNFIPDVGIGLEADLKQSPVIFNPSFSLTIPIWREKNAAQIRAAEAEADAMRSRFYREKIDLAVEFATARFSYKESSRKVTLYTDALLPKASRALEVARTGYIGGRSSFVDFLDAQRTLLEFDLARIESRAMQEEALAKLSLIIAGIVPAAASFVNRELEVSEQ
ncbi:MAG: TolC family protein [Deltaproteobacteria bacterium]|nr:TolC family protein [Deltaproteobacteria bacterium]